MRSVTQAKSRHSVAISAIKTAVFLDINANGIKLKLTNAAVLVTKLCVLLQDRKIHAKERQVQVC